MADSSTSSLTSTSHTLTIGPPSMATGSVPTLGDIRSALAFRDAIKKTRRATFVKPETTLPTAPTQYAQVALSELASKISDEQQEHIRERNAVVQALKKRKREGMGSRTAAAAAAEVAEKMVGASAGPVLKIRKVHTEGFEIPQILQQTNRILETSKTQLNDKLFEFDEEDGETKETNGTAADSDSEDDEAAEDEESGLEDEDDEDAEEEGSDDEDLEGLDEMEDDYDEDEDEELDGVNGADLGEDDDKEEEEDEDDIKEPEEDFIEDKEGLNDGFFDIDRFNKQSQWFEDQDARADPNTDQVSDEEEFDWAADPMAAPSKSSKKNAKGKKSSTKNLIKPRNRDLMDRENGDNNDDDDDDEGAPAFGDMDLDAPSGESDNEMDGEANGIGGLESGLEMDFTANDIFYKDFFAPPPRKRMPGEERFSDRRRQQQFGRNGHQQQEPFQPEEADFKRSVADIRRDLRDDHDDSDIEGGGVGKGDFGFDDEDDQESDNGSDVDALSDASAGDPQSRRSKHERQQAKILAEIRKLESAAIKDKNWAMSGEAWAGARPVNSLLEQDLDFEHIGKPVPVITQEVNEDIEGLVKRRILAQEFDEVHRRYGMGDHDPEREGRRGLTAIEDQQNQKGLAAVYEEEHHKQANADVYLTQSDERLKTEEAAVEAMWKDISATLDALTSWHYKPRPAEASVTVVGDVAKVAMEDAQPATAQGVSGSQSMLAPQEVYKPGESKESGDSNVVTVAKSGLPVARDEMTREEKQRRRRRNKERIKKSGSGQTTTTKDGVVSNVTASGGEKSATLAALKKSGVKVIGRRGEIEDLDGNKPKVTQAQSGAGNYKL